MNVAFFTCVFVAFLSRIHADFVSEHSKPQLAVSLLKEKTKWSNNFGQESCRRKFDAVIWLTYHRVTDNIAALARGDGRLQGARIAGRNISNVCDFDMGKYTSILGPDSHYQTLMSEHSFIIVMGFLVKEIYFDKKFVGTCSWKASRKGRPIPCQVFRTYNFTSYNFKSRAVVYWGPNAGPRVSLDVMQSSVAKLQPRNENLR